MKFISINIKDHLLSREENFSPNVNLIYSKENTRGKTTLIRILLYSLGYNIPNTQHFKFDHCDITTIVETKNQHKIELIRNSSDYIIANINGNKRTFVLPSQLHELHRLIFNIDNHDIFNNLLGAFYFDQEKGWTLLNRGTAIGSIHFNIEELIRGLSNIDCNQLIAKEGRIARQLEKFRQMSSITRYQESLATMTNNYSAKTYPETSTIELEKLLIKQKNLKQELTRIDKTLSDNKRIKQYIADLKLIIKLHDGTEVLVTEDMIVNLSDSIDFLITKHKLLASDLAKNSMQINQLQQEISHESEQLTFFDSESVTDIFDKKILTLPLDNISIANNISRLENELKNIRKSISDYTKLNNNVASSLYQNILRYAKELKISDAGNIPLSYIFTSNLKELSGAVLHKTVFAFKLAYIIEIQKITGDLLPIILDSPTGKEIDQQNIQMMFNILKRDFSENQIIIASIYNYYFDKMKVIEIEDRLLQFKS